jgi:peptidoglycan/LPS O-acetylase OafA/YrhL
LSDSKGIGTVSIGAAAARLGVVRVATSVDVGETVARDRSQEIDVAPYRGFRPDIQALRGLAVLMVVLFHAQVVLPGGFVGVDIFFVVSGFVIGRLLLAQFSSTGTMSFGSFYSRRARRLLPALGLMLTVVILASPLLAPLGAALTANNRAAQMPHLSSTGAAAALFSANLQLFRATAQGYFDVIAALNPLLHTWSLSVEEQFYFAIPALLLLAWIVGRRRNRSLRSLRRLVVALIAVSAALSLVLSYSSQDALRLAFFAPFTRAWEFAAGLAIVLLPRRWFPSSRVRMGWVVVGLGLIATAGLVFTGTTVFPGVAVLLPVLGAAFVIFGCTAPDDRELGTRTRSLLRPLIGLGDVSYSWYLWHWPLIVFAGAFWPNSGRVPLVVAAAVSLLPAWLSYRFVEHRFRATGRTRPVATVGLAMCCIAAPLIATVLAKPISTAISKRPALAPVNASGAPHADEASGCKNPTPLGERSAGSCTWGSPNSPTSVVLIGDSSAGNYSEALVGAAASTGAQLRIATLHGCAFIDATVKSVGTPAGCDNFVSKSLDYLIAHPPTVVAIANGIARYVDYNDVTLVDHATGAVATTEQQKDRVWQAGLERVVARLRQAGIRVVVIDVVPTPWANDVDVAKGLCSPLLLMVDPARCDPETFTVSSGRTPQLQRIDAAAAAAGGAEIWDFDKEICPSGRCVARRNGALVWSDPLHITVAASKSLVPAAAALLAHPGGPPTG